MARRGRGEGTIYKRPDGRWMARVSLEGGKRKDFYGKTRREVQDQLNDALKDKKEGTLIASPSQTVKQYLTYWLESIVKSSVRPSTYLAYDLNVRRALPYMGKYRLNALTPTHIQAYFGELLKQNLSQRTAEQAHEVLHNALSHAVKLRILGRNPADAVAVPRPEKKEMQTLNAEQVRQLLASSKEDQLYPLWMLFATTGLRLGEATGLMWSDIDFREKRVIVQRAAQPKKGERMTFVETKSQSSRRAVHITNTLVECLRMHQKAQREAQLRIEALGTGIWQDKDLIFSNEIGDFLTPSQVEKAFLKALAKAGLPRIRIHDLRHTAASLMLEANIHPKIVQEFLGHSSVNLTLSIYSHVLPTLHKEIAAQMERVIGEQGGNNEEL